MVYTIQFPCGRYYVGKTIQTLAQRRAEHFYESKKPNSYFLRALAAANRDDLRWQVYAETNNPAELDELEDKAIDELQAMYPTGFNRKKKSGGLCAAARLDLSAKVKETVKTEKWRKNYVAGLEKRSENEAWLEAKSRAAKAQKRNKAGSFVKPK